MAEVQEKEYIGMTIGPIFDTINLTSSPAALWAASYMFSSLTRFICEVLTEKGVPSKNIVSPYYDKDAKLLNKNDGVGLFHDRIVFCTEGVADVPDMAAVRNNAIDKLCTAFGFAGDDVAYIKEYVKVSWVKYRATNAIDAGAKALDCLELAKSFVFKEEQNPILSLFVNAKEEKDTPIEEQEMVGKNEAVKKLTKSFNNFQLRKGSRNVLKSLEDIVKTGSGFKKFKYYAMVRSDGDNMSQIIRSLKDDGEVTDYSETCLKYCSAVAEAVGEYGGVTIYSGGDDLLAILPCEKDGTTVFDFVSKVNGLFNKNFEKYHKPTSLSFGITIAYYKFPLYEALDASYSLLTGVAKKLKNCMAVNLQKHAGQSEGLIISNAALDDWIKYQKQTAAKAVVNGKKDENDKEENKNEILLSAMHKLEKFKRAFKAAKDKPTIQNLFVNTFDAAAHENNVFVHETLPELFHFLQCLEGYGGSRIYAFNEKGIIKDDAVLIMYYALRILKFFVEKDGGKE